MKKKGFFYNTFEKVKWEFNYKTNLHEKRVEDDFNFQPNQN